MVMLLIVIPIESFGGIGPLDLFQIIVPSGVVCERGRVIDFIFDPELDPTIFTILFDLLDGPGFGLGILDLIHFTRFGFVLSGSILRVVIFPYEKSLQFSVVIFIVSLLFKSFSGVGPGKRLENLFPTWMLLSEPGDIVHHSLSSDVHIVNFIMARNVLKVQ